MSTEPNIIIRIGNKVFINPNEITNTSENIFITYGKEKIILRKRDLKRDDIELLDREELIGFLKR